MKSLFDFSDVLNTQKFLSSYYRLLIPLGFRGHDINRNRLKDVYLSYTKYAKNFTDWAFGLNMSMRDYEKWADTLSAGPSMDGIVFPPFGEPKHEGIIPKKIPTNILHSADGLTHSMLDRIVNNIPHISIVDPAESFNTSCFSRLTVLIKEAVAIIVKKFPASIIRTLLPDGSEFVKGSYYDMTIGFLLKSLQRLMMNTSKPFFLILSALSHLLPIYWSLVTQIITAPIHIPFVYEWFTKRITR